MPSFRAKRAGASARQRYVSAIASTKAKRASRYTRSRVSSAKRRIGLQLRPHSFSRNATTLTVQSSPNYTTSSAALKFQLNDLISYGDFTGLFDRYKINMIVLKVQLEQNPDAAYRINGNTVANAANFYPKLWWATDYDDSAAVSLDEMKQLQNVKCSVLRPNSFITIKCKPAILAQTYRTVATTGYSPKWGQWIDCANVDVPHYGIKLCMDMNGYDASSNFQIRIEPKFYIQCKDVR